MSTKDTLCFATYLATADLDYGGGELDATVFGDATISAGKLNLSTGTVANVRYHAHNNAHMGQEGSIRFKLTPNYTGTPASSQIWYDLYAEDGTDKDRILFFHSSTGGNITLFLYDENATLQGNITFGAWSPSAGTEYEILLCFDVTNGATRLFIDGVQKGSTATSTMTRNTWCHFFRLGATRSGTETANFSIDDFIIYDIVLKTAHYESGYSLPLMPTITELTGFIFDCCGPINNLAVKARPYANGAINQEIFNQYKFTTIATTNASGFFKAFITVPPTGEQIEFKIGPQRYRATIADQATTDFSDLTLVVVDD